MNQIIKLIEMEMTIAGEKESINTSKIIYDYLKANYQDLNYNLLELEDLLKSNNKEIRGEFLLSLKNNNLDYNIVIIQNIINDLEMNSIIKNSDIYNLDKIIDYLKSRNTYILEPISDYQKFLNDVLDILSNSKNRYIQEVKNNIFQNGIVKIEDNLSKRAI